MTRYVEETVHNWDKDFKKIKEEIVKELTSSETCDIRKIRIIKEQVSVGGHCGECAEWKDGGIKIIELIFCGNKLEE
jgi:hypothetical protein